METGTYTDFSRIVHESVNPLRVPVNGTIEVTNRCPLDCVHCYNNLPMNDGVARNGELTLDDYRRVLDELADLGCLWLLFSGGEIFARHDFLDIYKHAVSRGLLVTLFTNATLITERIADELAALPPFDIEVTLYGATKETYEKLTGIPGSYAKCLSGIKRILDRGLPLKLKTVALTINHQEIGMMKSMAEELGVEFKFDPMISPRIDCSSSPLAVRLTPAEIVMMDLEDPTRVAEWRRLAIDLASPEVQYDEAEMPLIYDCGGGVNSFAIDPYGNLTICVLSHFDNYNVKSGSVREGWEKFLRGVRDKRATRITKCTTCALKSLCGSCAANAELEMGDPEAPVDFLCRTAHLRAEVFGVDVRPHGDCEYCTGGTLRAEIDNLAAIVHERDADAAAAARIAEPLAGASSCSTSTCGSCSAHTR